MPVELIVKSRSSGQELLSLDMLPKDSISLTDISHNPPWSVLVKCNEDDSGGQITINEKLNQKPKFGGKPKIILRLVEIINIPLGEAVNPIIIDEIGLGPCILEARHFEKSATKVA